MSEGAAWPANMCLIGPASARPPVAFWIQVSVVSGPMASLVMMLLVADALRATLEGPGLAGQR